MCNVEHTPAELYGLTCALRSYSTTLLNHIDIENQRLIGPRLMETDLDHLVITAEKVAHAGYALLLQIQKEREAVQSNLARKAELNYFFPSKGDDSNG